MKAAVPTSTAVFAISPSGQLRTDRAAQIQLFDRAAHFDLTTRARGKLCGFHARLIGKPEMNAVDRAGWLAVRPSAVS